MFKFEILNFKCMFYLLEPLNSFFLVFLYLITDHAEKVRHIVIPIWVYVFPLAIMARTTSVWLTVAIAAQRWIAVTFPLKVSVWAISCFSHNESIGSILVNEAAFKPTNLINVRLTLFHSILIQFQLHVSNSINNRKRWISTVSVSKK